MTSFHEPRAVADAVPLMGESFRQHYEQTARFREDRALAAELTLEAEPVLEALFTACSSPTEAPALHEAYALLTQLCRRAAGLDATASVAVSLPEAIAYALQAVGVALEPSLLHDLAIVAVEGYCAGRDERATQKLRRRAAEQQVALRLGPRCCVIALAGQHDEADLEPTLENFARTLLRNDVRSCLLDVSRLTVEEDDVARLVGRFCLQAATLGVQTIVFGASFSLRAQLASWTAEDHLTSCVDDYDRALGQMLSAAGFLLRPRRRWTRLFLPARSGLVR